MKKFALIFPIALLSFPALMLAQAPKPKLHGCVDSPENPTAVLGLMVGAASIGYLMLRNRAGVRTNSQI